MKKKKKNFKIPDRKRTFIDKMKSKLTNDKMFEVLIFYVQNVALNQLLLKLHLINYWQMLDVQHVPFQEI